MKILVENKDNSKDIRELIQEDIKSSVFIDAGAGAGKTTSIVQRVLNQIKAGIKPGRLVIITFTNKATEEILSRINDAVYDAAIKEKNPQIKKVLTEAFNNLSSMTISTIHSFCYTILSERSLNIKLPIGVELMEDEEFEEQKDKIFNQWIKSLTKEDYDILAPDGIIDASLFSKMHNYLNLFTKMEDSVYEIEKIDINKLIDYKRDLVSYIDLLISYADEFAAVANKDREDVLKKNAKLLIELEEALIDFDDRDFKDFVDGNLEDEKIEILSNAFSYLKDSDLTTRLRSEDIKSVMRDYNENLAYEREKLEKAKKYFNTSKDIIKNRIAIEYAYKAYEYFKLMRKKIKISKDELLYLTNEIIKDDLARKYFASKYDCIYVDEFQDTDHIQADFIWNLSEEIDKYHELNNIECGSLVVVGDPKQSIYRFRGADPEVFFKIKDDYKNKDSVIYTLNFNFRSNNLILDYVNREFMDKDIQGGTLKYSPMLYDNNHMVPEPINDKCIAGVFHLENELNLSEEELVASLIKKLIDDKYLIPKFNRTKKIYEWKELNYNDFMVLFHQFNNSIRFINAFKDYGIPVSVAGRVDFKNEHGLKVFKRLFRGIVTPQDKIAKMGALEALRMNNYDKEFKNEDESFKFYNDIYNSLLKDTKELSGYGKALYLKEHLEFLLGDKDLYQSINVKITQIIENSFAKNISNAISLADYFDKYLDSEISEELILDESIPTIRFMNAHKSKGLEANVVIWVDNGKECTRDEKVLKDKNVYHFGIDLNDKLKSIAMQEQRREIGRLEYVAATRAMNVLIFSPMIAEDKLFNRDGYDYHFNDLKDLQIGNLPKEKANKLDQKTPLEYEPKELIFDNDYKPNIIHTSPSKYEVHEGRGKSINFDSNRPFGNVLGTIMHRSLELLILRRKNNNLKDYNENDIKAIAKMAIYESANDIDFDKDYQKYERFLIAVLNSIIDFYQNINLLNDAIMIEPEYTYSLFDKEGKEEFKIDDNSKIYLNGTMDLFIKYKDRILIIDYKSDFIGYQNDEQFKLSLINDYKNQLDVYRKSAEIMFNMKNIETKIIYFKDYDYDNLKIVPVMIEI